jgi:hypothetical protein
MVTYGVVNSDPRRDNHIPQLLDHLEQVAPSAAPIRLDAITPKVLLDKALTP